MIITILIPFMHIISYVYTRFCSISLFFPRVNSPFHGKHAFFRVFVGFQPFSEQKSVRGDVP